MSARRAAAVVVRLACVPVFAVLAACSTPALDSRWSDPALAASPAPLPRAARTQCLAPDAVARAACASRLTGRFAELGFDAVPMPDPVPVPGADGADGAPAAGPADALYAEVRLFPEQVAPGSGAALGVGLPGIGVGIGRGIGIGVGMGFGMAIPVGGSAPAMRWIAELRVVDGRTQHTVWVGRAHGAADQDAAGQAGRVVDVLVDRFSADLPAQARPPR